MSKASKAPEPSISASRAREILHHCYKRLNESHDLLTAKQDLALRKELQSAQNALTANDPKLSHTIDHLVDSFTRAFPSGRAPGLRENGEIILVAIIIAMAFRAFFLQPFKIPTGSMQPTLNGINILPVTAEAETWWYPWVCRPIWGEERVRVVAQSPGSFGGSERIKTQFLHNSRSKGNGFFQFFPTDATRFQIGNHLYQIPVDSGKFESEIKPKILAWQNDHGPFKTGDVICDFIIQTGDQLFVDRVSYYFVKPKRGDVFVFETRGIKYNGQALAGDFYIKRLAGTPGDALQIKDRKLFVNDQLASEFGFQRVMSLRDDYQGYGTHTHNETYLGSPESIVTLKEKEFFALGDNSFNSLDSRYWGVVPHENIVGKAFFVWWPFNRHFGRID